MATVRIIPFLKTRLKGRGCYPLDTHHTGIAVMVSGRAGNDHGILIGAGKPDSLPVLVYNCSTRRLHAGSVFIKGKGILFICNAVIVIVRVCIVTRAVPVRVPPLGWIEWEGIFCVRYIVIVVIRVRIVTRSIPICIRPFGPVRREGILIVRHPVPITVPCCGTGGQLKFGHPGECVSILINRGIRTVQRVIAVGNLPVIRHTVVIVIRVHRIDQSVGVGIHIIAAQCPRILIIAAHILGKEHLSHSEDRDLFRIVDKLGIKRGLLLDHQGRGPHLRECRVDPCGVQGVVGVRSIDRHAT